MSGIGVTGLQYKSPGLGVANSIYSGRLNYSKNFNLVGIGRPNDVGIYSNIFDEIIFTDTIIDIENFLYILKKSNVTGIILNRDEEIEIFSETAHLLNTLNISVFLPDIKYVRIVNDKYLFYTYLCENGYNVPEFLNTSNISFPVIIKGRRKGVYLAKNSSEFKIGVDYIKKVDGDVLVQKFINGIPISVAGFVAENVVLLLGIRKLAMDVDGTTLACVTIYNEDFISVTLDLLQNLKWVGAFEIEFIYNPLEDRYYILEMNSRYPFWIGICSCIDYNIPYIHSLMLLGDDDLEYLDGLSKYDTGKIFYLNCSFLKANFTNLKEIY